MTVAPPTRPPALDETEPVKLTVDVAAGAGVAAGAVVVVDAVEAVEDDEGELPPQLQEEARRTAVIPQKSRARA